MATPVIMFAPDGSTGEIPFDKVAAAQQAGFKRAMTMVSPDGKSSGFVPEDRVNDAAKSGFRFGNVDKDQPSNASLYKQALLNPVGSGAHEQGFLGGLEQIGGRAMQAMAAPILHPIDTAVSMAKTLGTSPTDPNNPLFQRLVQGGEEWKKDRALALENAAGDVAGAVEGGRIMGAGLQKAIPPALKVAGRTALLGKTPQAAYESALKPSTTLSPSVREAMAQTGLKEGIPVSKGGLEKIGDLIENYNQKIADTINKDPNRPIDPNAVATRSGDTVNRFSNQVNATTDLNAIEASRQQFLQEQGATAPRPTGLLNAQGQPIMSQGTPAPPMGAATAQAMKQGTYRVLRGKFGEQGSAAVEAQKDLARGLKEELATQFPEINELNASESKLLTLQPALERAVNRISNHQAIGIGTPIAGAATKAVTGSGAAGAVMATLKAVLDNPAIKSKLAIAVSKGGKMPYATAAAKVAAYSSALGSVVQSPGSSGQSFAENAQP